jgi:hypothetical protein
LVDRENADSFLLKIKNRDDYVFKEVMKALLSLKNGEITLEKLTVRFEELLAKYPDLLEEAYLYTDPKKVKFVITFSSARLGSKEWYVVVYLFRQRLNREKLDQTRGILIC